MPNDLRRVAMAALFPKLLPDTDPEELERGAYLQVVRVAAALAEAEKRGARTAVAATLRSAGERYAREQVDAELRHDTAAAALARSRALACREARQIIEASRG